MFQLFLDPYVHQKFDDWILKSFLDGFIFLIIIASPNSPIYLSLSPLLITAYFCHFPMSHVSDKIGNPCSAQKLLLSGRFDSGGKHIAPTCHVQEIEHSQLLKDASKPVEFQNHYFRNYICHHKKIKHNITKNIYKTSRISR